jgi:hypothetical protein
MDVYPADLHTDHFGYGAANVVLYIPANFAHINVIFHNNIQVSYDRIVLNLENNSICSPRRNRLTAPGTGYILLTPGVSSVVRRAIVINTSGAMVVTPGPEM